MSNLERPLARPDVTKSFRAAIVRKLLFVGGVLLLLGLVVSKLNLSRDLHRLARRS